MERIRLEFERILRPGCLQGKDKSKRRGKRWERPRGRAFRLFLGMLRLKYAKRNGGYCGLDFAFFVAASLQPL